MKKLLTVFIVCLALAVPLTAYAQTGVGSGIIFEEQSGTPTTPEATKVHLYVDTTSTPVLKMVDDAGSVTSITAGSGDNTLNAAYDQGAQGAGKAITVDSGAIALSNTDADNNALLTINASPATAAAAEGIVITIGGNSTGAALEFENTGTGYDVEGTGALWYATKAGAGFFTSLTATTFTPAMLTVSGAGSFGGNLTLDDGATDSPSFIMTDETDESVTFSKLDAGYLTITTVAGDGVNVLTGNLKVGNGSPGDTLDGEDAYIEGTFEVDGTAQFDGTITAVAADFSGAVTMASTLALSENVTFTMAADEYLLLDADTTEHTETAGALDINLKSKTDNTAAINLNVNYMAGGGDHDVAGVLINLDDDADAAAELIGIEIASSDDDASAVTKGIKIQNSVSTSIQLIAGVATTALDIDAPLQTQTAGTIDIDFSSVTNGAEAINIDVDVGDTQAGSEIITAVLADLDDDTASQTSTIRGFSAVSTDVTGEASTLVQGFYSSGCDVAAQFDNGYVWIGTGSTPGITPGDDDLFVEGTAEVDGELQADGSIDVNSTIVGAGDNTTTMTGITGIVEAYTGADNVIAITEAGTTYTNTGDADGSMHTLPEASTCIGATFTFIVTAAQSMVIELDNADKFLHLTLDAGDQIQSSTVNDSVTVRALDATNWGVISAYPLAGDWADGGA